MLDLKYISLICLSGAYWRQLGQDYADVFHDTVRDIKSHPLKSSVYISGELEFGHVFYFCLIYFHCGVFLE